MNTLRPLRGRRLAAPAFALFLLTAGVCPAGAAAPSAELVDAFAADPMSFFFELRATEAIEAGQVLLTRSDFTGQPREEVLTALGAIYLATGREDQARAAFLEILNRDPGYDLEHPELLPPPIVQLFYRLRDEKTLAQDEPPAFDIRTVAVGEIENNSIVHGAYDLDKFARGLTHIIISDLKEATPLRIVDRQRLGVIRDEIRMSSSALITDPKYRVPIGKLTGAQSFLFGSVIQASKDKVRLDLRWVDTSTGEILLAEGVETKLKSSDDLFKLERKVLLDLLLPRIHALVGAAGEDVDVRKTLKPYLDARKKELPRGTSYVDLLLKTGEAVLAEERGDYAAAQTAWSEVHALNPADADAQGRAVALNAYVDLSGEAP